MEYVVSEEEIKANAFLSYLVHFKYLGDCGIVDVIIFVLYRIIDMDSSPRYIRELIRGDILNL